MTRPIRFTRPSSMRQFMCLSALFCYLTITALPASAAEFVPLGWLGEDPPSPGSMTLESDARGISDDGLAVIGHSSGADGSVFRWTPAEGMVGLRPGTFGTTPVISPDGSTVAWSRDNETHIWSEDFGLVSVTQFTNADGNTDMSDDGSVIVGRNSSIWSRDKGIEPLTFTASDVTADGSVIFGTSSSGLHRWSSAEGESVVGSVAGDNRYEILGVSNDGAIVVGTTGPDLWRWTSDTGLVVIEEAAAGTAFRADFPDLGRPRLMSADGTAFAVNRTTSGSLSGYSSHRWTEEAGLLAIPGLPGFADSLVLEMSNDGTVILGGSISPSNEELWLWTEELGTRSLTDILVSQGVFPSVLAGWDLVGGNGLLSLSGDGSAISGSGTNPDGIREAWVAYFDPFVIPEPSSLLLTTGLVGVVLFRKRRARQSLAAFATATLLGGAFADTAPAAEFIPLGALSRALSISDDGTVISGNDLSSGDTRTVFRWTHEAGISVIGDDNFNGRPAMSADGSVVVWDAIGTRNARVWSENHGLIEFDLEFVSLGESSLADESISHDGSVLVGRAFPFPADSPTGPVRWSFDNGFVELGFNVQDLLVSSDGTMVAGTPRSALQEASGPPFRWNETQGVVDLGVVPGDNHYRINGISADGSVITGVSWGLADPANPNSARSAGSLWRWTLSEGLTVLADGTSDGSYTPQQFSAGRWLSADGSVLVGNRGALASAIDRESFRWTEESGIQPLLGLPGYPRSVVLDMTPDGTWVFGQSYVDTLGGELAPWLWSEATGTLNLLEVFESQGLDSSFEGWNSLWNGVGNRGRISADGHAIIGTGSNPDGLTEGWVIYLDPLLIPEPSSLLLATAGLVSVLLLRKWRMRQGLCAYAAAAVVCGTFVGTTHAAEFVPLGILGADPSSGLQESRSNYISNDGSVIVGTTTGPIWNNNRGGAYRWTRETGMAPLDDINVYERPNMSADGSTVAFWAGPTGSESRVWSVEHGLTVFNDTNYLNNRWFRPGYSVVTGYAYGVVSADGDTLVGQLNDTIVRWTHDGGFEDLGFSAGEAMLLPDGDTILVNALGQLSRWTAKQGLEVLTDLPSGISELQGAAPDASVAVALTRPSVGAPSSLWRWTAESGNRVLQEGTADSQFRRDRTHVSANGSVITGERYSDGLVERAAYRWTEERGFETLLLPGYTRSTAYDITPDGKWILGSSFSPVDPSQPVNSLMLWSEATGLISLQTVFELQGIWDSMANWQELLALERGLPQISADGLAITSTGVNPDGNHEAWIVYLDALVVPEPRTLLLATAGLVGVVLARRRSGLLG